MTTEQPLGTIEKVGVRDVWPMEGTDFTPWLSKNLDKLGAELGIDLELVEVEAEVGTFKLDVRARDANTNGEVVIENQFGDTDHSHLGKLLTYAGGFEAQTVVWIAEKFRDEHRQALDFLNLRTGENTQFFGVEVQLWKIGNSLPAPKFMVVAIPNEWRKQTGNSLRGVAGASERSRRYQAFFQPLVAILRGKHRFTDRSQVDTRNWSWFPTGVSGGGVRYGAGFARNREARVDVYIDNGDVAWNKELFDRLEEDKTEIESMVEGEFDWQRLDDKRACRISVVRPGSIDEDEEALEVIRSWMVDRLLKFKEVFGPRLEELTKSGNIWKLEETE